MVDKDLEDLWVETGVVAEKALQELEQLASLPQAVAPGETTTASSAIDSVLQSNAASEPSEFGRMDAPVRPKDARSVAPRTLRAGAVGAVAALAVAVWLSRSPKPSGTQAHETSPQSSPKYRACVLAGSTALSDAENWINVKAGDKKYAPADTTPFQRAAPLAEEATRLDPECAEAWAALANARYRIAYYPCAPERVYADAEKAANKAVGLVPSDDSVRAAALRNLGRIRAAQRRWDDARVAFDTAKSLAPENLEARLWLKDLEVRSHLSPALVATTSRVFSGERLEMSMLEPLNAAELEWIRHAIDAHHGRQINLAAEDWFFFCEDSPVRTKSVVRVEWTTEDGQATKGSVDSDNRMLVNRAKKAR